MAICTRWVLSPTSVVWIVISDVIRLYSIPLSCTKWNLLRCCNGTTGILSRIPWTSVYESESLSEKHFTTYFPPRLFTLWCYRSAEPFSLWLTSQAVKRLPDVPFCDEHRFTAFQLHFITGFPVRCSNKWTSYNDLPMGGTSLIGFYGQKILLNFCRTAWPLSVKYFQTKYGNLQLRNVSCSRCCLKQS